MSALLAAALASGELVCEFSDGYRKSLLAALAGDPPRTELVLVYRDLAGDAARVLASGRAGQKPVLVRPGAGRLQLVEPDGASVRVTTLGECVQSRTRDGEEHCRRFSATHAWILGSYDQIPSGAATGFCEPWKVE